VFHFLQQHQIEVVVLTSMSGVKYLVEALDQTGLARLRQCCAVVVGDRMAKQCQNGQWFAMIYVAADASDASIVSALEQCTNH
jgi:uroporphyrinogen-III synthase